MWAGKGMPPSHSWQGKNASWNSPLEDGFAAYSEKHEILEWETQTSGYSEVSKSLREKEGEVEQGCFWTVVLEKTLESPLDCKGTKPVHPKGNQSWIFIGKTDAEVPILWLLDGKNWLFGKDLEAGKDWRQEEKGVAEDEMVGWHHRLNGHEFEQALRDGEGQESLVCYSPWGCKESDTTERLNSR